MAINLKISGPLLILLLLQILQLRLVATGKVTTYDCDNIYLRLLSENVEENTEQNKNTLNA